MKTKSKASLLVKYFVHFIQTQFQMTIKTIRSDNGPGIFFKYFYSTQGIHHPTSCVNNLQQNGLVERQHQHLFGVTHVLLFQSHLPKLFWSYTPSHVVHLINSLPYKMPSYKSHFNFLYNDMPDYSNIRTFGCLVYACSPT